MNKLALLVSFTILSCIVIPGCDDDDPVSILESEKFHTFNDAMRELWSDHVLWTRNVITNIIDDLPGTTEAVNRLLQNQDDIGDAIKPYYGDANGEALTTLLREHITTAADLLTAAKNGDTNAFNTANAAWYANADEIAAFLNSANPEFFPLADMKAMMKEHLDLTLEEATARLEGNFAADVAAFDMIFDQIMEMADMLSEGIANQFPEKF
jgi:hypothetical protein